MSSLCLQEYRTQSQHFANKQTANYNVMTLLGGISNVRNKPVKNLPNVVAIATMSGWFATAITLEAPCIDSDNDGWGWNGTDTCLP